MCDAENFGKLRDKIQHRAVADGDAFWHTGASACEVDIQRVNVHSLTAAGCQQGSVRGCSQQIVKPDDLPAVPQRGGCGSAGGDWEIVEDMIRRVFDGYDGEIQIWKLEE